MSTKDLKVRGSANLAGLAVVVLAVGILVSCAPLGSAGPDQVSSENPSVTYRYSSDEELLEAMQEASAFCSRYQATAPHSGVITENEDGTESVTFECVPVTTAGSATTPSELPMTYTYRSPQELLQISQNAEAVCRGYGKGSTATVTTNLDGSKTATFECVP